MVAFVEHPAAEGSGGVDETTQRPFASPAQSIGCQERLAETALARGD